uniref:Transmembrane protein 43 n=1 Tax=Pygocentrus nattereri TaxID=42514 RepID=A0A3B4CUI2_PYGNA
VVANYRWTEGRDQHSRIHSRPNPGFLERLGETMGGMMVGVGLFFVSFYVLFTNEGRAIRTAASLDEGLSQVLTLRPDMYVDPQNDNRLVHLSAPLRTSQPLYDPNYKVAVQAVKLKRNVEMYQWVEYQDSREYKEGGETKTETTYTYNTEWKSEVINSRNFDQEIGHTNPSAMAVESVTVVAPDVWVGYFFLSKGLIDQINNFQTLHLGALPVTDPFLTVHEDYFYHTANPRRPEVKTHVYTLKSAVQTLNTSLIFFRQRKLKPFKTRSGDTLEILYLEELTAEEVFAKEHKLNDMKTWALRAGGWFLMFLGISLTTRIIYTLVDWVPLLRDLVSVGLKLFALCVSCCLSLLTIAAGWLLYRPLLAGLIAALALVPILIARSRAPDKKHQ